MYKWDGFTKTSPSWSSRSDHFIVGGSQNRSFQNHSLNVWNILERWKKNMLRIVKQMLKIEITLNTTTQNTYTREFWKQGKMESYYSMCFMTIHCIKQELLCWYSQNNFGCDMASLHGKFNILLFILLAWHVFFF